MSVDDLHRGLSSFVFRMKQITQNPVVAIPCGFDPRFRHQNSPFACERASLFLQFHRSDIFSVYHRVVGSESAERILFCLNTYVRYSLAAVGKKLSFCFWRNFQPIALSKCDFLAVNNCFARNYPVDFLVILVRMNERNSRARGDSTNFNGIWTEFRKRCLPTVCGR